jgi:xylose isomerase
VATAVAGGLLGSIDANRGDPQNGWDTDQFPNSVEELSLAMHEILRHGGFKTGGFNFDTKLRRQSMDRTDLFHGHIGGIDTLARSLLVADAMLRDGVLERAREHRYAGWNGERGQRIMSGGASLESLADEVSATGLSPTPVSGRQEWLEGEVNRFIWDTPRAQ